jgi:hypothetical protein
MAQKMRDYDVSLKRILNVESENNELKKLLCKAEEAIKRLK